MEKNILVVDDDEGIAEVVRLVLEGEGYRVRTSMSGNNFPHFDDEMPDLILLDVLLLGTDGRELCRRLKSNKETAHIPVIMLSAHSDAGKIADAGGADDFLEKPFDVDELIAIVEKYLTPEAIS